MSANAELLNFLHKNAQMGRDSIDHILTIVEDGAFRTLLEKHQENYSRICIATSALLGAAGEEPQPISGFARTMSSAMIDVATIGNRTASRFASMLLDGTKRGLAELEEKMRIYTDARPEIQNLCEAYRNELTEAERELREFV